MSSRETELSMQVIDTVAKALETDPAELPQLHRTIDADALDLLFHGDSHPPGAYVVFPYSGTWVIARSDGTVDVFDGFKATNRDDVVPDEIMDPSADDQLLILNRNGERHVFHDEELETIHAIIEKAGDSSEAWDGTIEYARER